MDRGRMSRLNLGDGAVQKQRERMERGRMSRLNLGDGAVQKQRERMEREGTDGSTAPLRMQRQSGGPGPLPVVTSSALQSFCDPN